jgi:hypothetical protein
MNDIKIKKAVLKVAQENPEFRRQLVAAAQQLELLPPKVNLNRLYSRAEKVLHALPRMVFTLPDGTRTPEEPGLNKPIVYKAKSGKLRGQWVVLIGVKTGGRGGGYGNDVLYPSPEMKRGISTLEREFGLEYVDFWPDEKGWGTLVFLPVGRRANQKEAGSKEDFSRHVKNVQQAVRRLEQYTRKQDWQSARMTLQAIQNELKDADWLLMGLVP